MTYLEGTFGYQEQESFYSSEWDRHMAKASLYNKKEAEVRYYELREEGSLTYKMVKEDVICQEYSLNEDWLALVVRMEELAGILPLQGCKQLEPGPF